MSRQFGIAVATTLALTTVIVASSQNPPSPSATGPTTQQQQQAATPVAPIAQDQTAAAKAKADAQTDADRQEARLTQEVTKWSAIAQAASAVFVTVFTGVLVWYSHRGWQVAKTATDAAKRSADTAADQLRLLYRPIIDIEKLRVRATRREPGDPLVMTIGWRIYNAGSVAAKFVWIGTVFRVELPGESDVEASRSFENVRAPGRGWVYSTELKLSPKAEAAYITTGLAISMQIRVLLEDPWGKANYQLFTRRIRCGDSADVVESHPASNAIYDWNKNYTL